MLLLPLILVVVLTSCTPASRVEYVFPDPPELPPPPTIFDWQEGWPSQRMKKYDCVETQPLQRARNGETQETTESESRVDATIAAGEDKEGAGGKWV